VPSGRSERQRDKRDLRQEQTIGGFMNVTFMADDVEATAKDMPEQHATP